VKISTKKIRLDANYGISHVNRNPCSRRKRTTHCVNREARRSIKAANNYIAKKKKKKKERESRENNQNSILLSRNVLPLANPPTRRNRRALKRRSSFRFVVLVGRAILSASFLAALATFALFALYLSTGSSSRAGCRS